MEVLKLTQTKEHIAQILRNQIFSGTIPDGEELAQELVAEKLGVSRMPVREAFQILELEGILERLPNRRMRVIGIKQSDIFHNFRILSALESEFASMLLEDDIDISPLAGIFEDYKSAVLEEKREVCGEKELAFHIQISILLGNKYTIQMHQKLLNGCLSYVLNRFSIQWENNLNRLQEILAALENKNKKYLRELFDDYFKEISQVMTKEG